MRRQKISFLDSAVTYEVTIRSTPSTLHEFPVTSYRFLAVKLKIHVIFFIEIIHSFCTRIERLFEILLLQL